ncbi:MAG: hypothetical protein NVSMB66_7460 [Candidatus Doudnabacteria bacterium]
MKSSNRKSIYLNVAITIAAMLGFLVSQPLTKADTPSVASPLSTNSFTAQIKEKTQAFFRADSQISNFRPVFVHNSTPGLKNIYRFETIYSKEQIVSKYADKIVYIEAEHIVKIGATNFGQPPAVNDPGFSSDPSNVDRQWALYKAHFVEAWPKISSNNNVVIAEIDTGIDATHEDLSSGQIVPGYNFLSSTIISSTDNSDDNGHGTLIAGVMSATQNNFRGIAGAAPNSLVMPLKALDSRGSGNSADVAAAIVYAADHAANVINMSLGGIGFSNDTTLSNAIKYAFRKNTVLVAAAGNDVATTGGNLDLDPVFPICNDNGENMIIGVSATDINDQKASFSNYGKACVDVSAPGKRILSTINFDPVSHTPSPNTYAYASGTSLATPFVSAQAAIIKAAFPNLTSAQIRDRIIKSTDSIDGLNLNTCNSQSCAGLIGSGRINVLKSLDPALITQTIINEGDLVQDSSNGVIYYIAGGNKNLVSSFVMAQRFGYQQPKSVDSASLQNFPLGAYALPNQNTVFKSANSPVVYVMIDGIKRPLTFQIYLQRNISQVAVLTDAELSSWITGQFMPPLDGTIVRTKSGKTLYWTIDGLLHPINYKFWVDKGLKGRAIMVISNNDLRSYPSGGAFIK